MALQAKVRGNWRTVSPAMARRFRARGVEVRDTAAPDAEKWLIAPGAVVQVPPDVRVVMPQDRRALVDGADLVKVTERAPVPPPPPWPDRALSVAEAQAKATPWTATPIAEIVIETPGVADAALSMKLDAAQRAEHAAADLTDEELERLTAPDGE